MEACPTWPSTGTERALAGKGAEARGDEAEAGQRCVVKCAGVLAALGEVGQCVGVLAA